MCTKTKEEKNLWKTWRCLRPNKMTAVHSHNETIIWFIVEYLTKHIHTESRWGEKKKKNKTEKVTTKRNVIKINKGNWLVYMKTCTYFSVSKKTTMYKTSVHFTKYVSKTKLQ